MKHGVFSVFDVKIGGYMQPFFSQTKGTALRAFMDVLTDKQHQFCKYPEDYSLIHIGWFDDVTGTFASVSNETLGTAADLVVNGPGSNVADFPEREAL